jgi:alpha 1,3-mannosyltransferase
VGDLEYSFHKGDTGIMGKVNEEDNDKDWKTTEQHENHRALNQPPDETSKNGTDEDPANSEGPQKLLPDEELPRPDTEAEDKNVTICAPQVLHFAADGDPLWFNGWILNNKFDKKHAKAGEFEVYMREPRDITEPEAWKLGEHNMCCLTGAHTTPFNEEELKIVKTIIEIAKDVGAYDKD